MFRSIMFLVLACVAVWADAGASPLKPELIEKLQSQIEFTDEERAFLQSHPEIRVGVDKDFTPYTGFSAAGSAEGIAIDFLDIVAAITGLQFHFVPDLPWSQILSGAKKRQIDLIATATPREERKAYLNFTDFNIPTPWIVLTRSGDPGMPATASDLSGHSAALVRDYAVSAALLQEFPDVLPKWYDTPAAALHAVSTGEADVFAGVIGVSTHLAHRYGLVNLTTLGPLPVQPDGQRYAIRKDWPLLRSVIDKVLQPLSLNDRNRLQQEWLPVIRSGAPDGAAVSHRLQLNNEEREWLATRDRVRICVDPDWMPYEKIDENGKHTGIAADYMALFSSNLGIDFDLVPTVNWVQSEEYAKARKCDILSMLNRSAKRQEYLDFTDPYVEAPVVLATSDHVSYVGGLKGVTGKTLGIVGGYVYEDLIRSRYPEVTIVTIKSVADGLNKVSRGEIFATIGSLYVLTYQIQQLGLTDLKVAGQTEFINRFRIGIRNDDPVLVSLLRKAVSNRDPKQENEILQGWISVRMEHGTDYRLLLRVLAGLAILGAFFAYRHFVTTRHNQQLSRANANLERLSREDQLTGIANRKHLDDTLEREIQRVKRYGHGLSVIILDIDRFKQINDNFGHQAGDMVLVQLAEAMQHLVRETDLLGRWGGEEFVIISPATGYRQALALAEKLRIALERLNTGQVGTVTASFGVSEWQPQDDKHSLIKRADKALYKAKEKGRNRVEAG